MFQSISFSDFNGAFKSHERMNQFSCEGRQALFDYLEEYEESTGEKLELDVIALCCDYTEYESLEDLQANYDQIESMEDLEDHTTVIPVGEKGLIIQNF